MDVVVCVSNQRCLDSGQVFDTVICYQVNVADNGSEGCSFIFYLENSIKVQDANANVVVHFQVF